MDSKGGVGEAVGEGEGLGDVGEERGVGGGEEGCVEVGGRGEVDG